MGEKCCTKERRGYNVTAGKLISKAQDEGCGRRGEGGSAAAQFYPS